MTEIGIRALKQNASAVVARAVAGDDIVITDRGRPVARLVPFEQTGLSKLRAEGRVRPPRSAEGGLPDPAVLPAGLDVDAVLTELSASRDDRF